MKAFDDIAAEWDARNKQPRLFLRLLLPSIKKNSLVLYPGCGSGRNVPALLQKAAFVAGVDSSRKLLLLARKNCKQLVEQGRAAFLCGRMEKLFFEKNFFGAITCLNSFHHLRAAQRRLALKEFFRVLSPGGFLSIVVWNRQQKKFVREGSDALIAWRKKNGRNALRYYHFFGERELRGLVLEAGFVRVKTFFEKNGKKVPADGAHNLVLTAFKPHRSVF